MSDLLWSWSSFAKLDQSPFRDVLGMQDNYVIGLGGISKIFHTFYRHRCQQEVTFCRHSAISLFTLTSWEDSERAWFLMFHFNRI